jgi:hypothetical protein
MPFVRPASVESFRRGCAPASSAGEGTACLAAGSSAGRALTHSPEGMRPTVLGLRALGGGIAPAPEQPRWIRYGDSIAEGWRASEPAGAWPHVAVARRRSDPALTLVRGLALVPRERLPDGMHPDDAGHVLMARAIDPAIRAALEGAQHA